LALHFLGNTEAAIGDYPAARSHYEESLAICREMGEKVALARPLLGLGRLAWRQGDYKAARRFYEESLALRRELRDPFIYHVLFALGLVARREGDDRQAVALLEECLTIARERGVRDYIPKSLYHLAEVARCRGEDTLARARYAESLAIARELEADPDVAACLEGLARVAIAQKQWERAARLFGVAQARRDAIPSSRGGFLLALDQSDSDRDLAAVRTALGEEAFAAAWAEGRAMSLQEAIVYASGEADQT
jgi:tetratricopeptide (TPR) repeat protein